MVPYASIAVALWAVWAAYWVGAAFLNRKPSLRRESTGSWLSWRLLTVAAWILLFAPVSVAGLGQRFVPSTDFGSSLGLALCLAGLLYSVWARRVLGSNWSSVVTVKDQHQLIQRGPYAYTRHPIYTGILSAALGTALVAGQWRALLGLACLAAAFQLKLSVEERFMREQFGERYDAYAARVKRLLPWIY